MKEDITICIDDERITLKISQTQDYQEIHEKNNNKIYQYLYLMTKSSVIHQ